MSAKLDFEDYNEPKCPTCSDMYVKNDERPLNRVPMDRVTSKLDEYFFGKDFEGAERHLKYWLEEARAGRDRAAEISITGELMGFYRQTGKRERAFESAEEGLRLIEKYGYSGTLTAATTALNAATVNKAFGEAERAVALYESARQIYEEHLDPADRRLAGLYNNEGLALCDLSRYTEAEELYKKAISIMENAEEGEPEAAISHLNLADCVYLRLGGVESTEEVERELEEAGRLLEKSKERTDGYYAYVCERCASSFGFYGHFLYEKELNERAKRIYERA